MDPKGKLETIFSLGLGESVNNQAKASSLLQSIIFVIELRITNFIGIDISITIIKLMLSKYFSSYNKINSIVDHSHKKFDNF
jgi:hypothetical protein